MSTQAEIPTVESVLVKARAYYVDHPSGGALHIALDDGNMRDSDVHFCQKEAVKTKDKAGKQLAMDLLCLTEKQRELVYAKLHNYDYESD